MTTRLKLLAVSTAIPAALAAFVAQTAKSADGRANPPGEPPQATAHRDGSPYPTAHRDGSPYPKTPNSALRAPNILFIIADDLRPELGCYGYRAAITPNIDRLAASGVRFNNAYCQAALCGPSRGSLLSGLRPSANGYIHNNIRFRAAMPGVETLPEFFGRNGYATIALGKIYHDGDRAQMAGTFNSKAAIPEFSNTGGSEYKDPANRQLLAKHRRKMAEKYGQAGVGALATGPVCEFYDAPDEEYHDGHITTSAIATMKRCAAEGKPFFLGVGYKKPHLSFIAPKKYWDLYEGREIPLAANTTPPKGAPAISLHDSFEMRTRLGVPKYGPFSPDYQRYLMRGYLACVSFIDAQVGRLIDGLHEAGLAGNTIIVFCGDHGWHLGEMGVWGKATNYEIANRVPLLIIDPRIGRKGTTAAVVEFLDLYPTLADLAGLAAPAALQGRSLKNVLQNPEQTGDTVAISQFPCPALREWAGVKTDPNVRKEYFDRALNDIEARIRIEDPDTPLAVYQENVIGYTIRDNRYRYVAWVDQSAPRWKILAEELYDQLTDPDETTNLIAVAASASTTSKTSHKSHTSHTSHTSRTSNKSRAVSPVAAAKTTAANLQARLWKTLKFEERFF